MIISTNPDDIEFIQRFKRALNRAGEAVGIHQPTEEHLKGAYMSDADARRLAKALGMTFEALTDDGTLMIDDTMPAGKMAFVFNEAYLP